MGKRISDLDWAPAALSGSELIEIEIDGRSYKGTPQMVAALLGDAANTAEGVSVQDSAGHFGGANTVQGALDALGARPIATDVDLRGDLASTASGKGAILVKRKLALSGCIERTLYEASLDSISVKEFGAIGDGASHPLSQRFATLAEAQEVYPHAVALTDEIDWAAWQAAINARQSPLSQGSVLAPDGAYVTNRTLVVTQAITLRAMARGCASITKTSAGDLITAGPAKIEGINFFHNGTSGSTFVSTGDDTQLIGCGFRPSSGNPSAMVVLKHANVNLDACGFSGSNASQWCVDVVADTGNFCINGTIGGQTTMYGNCNGVRFRTGTGGRPEGWSLETARIIVTGAVSVEVQSCLSIDVTTCTLDQATAYAVKLAPTGSGIDALTVDDCYIATPGNLTTGKGVAAVAGSGGIRALSVTNCHFELCRDGFVTDSQMSGVRFAHNTCDNIAGVSCDYNGSVAVSIVDNFFRGNNIALRLVDGSTGDQVIVDGNNFDATSSIVYTPTNRARFEFGSNTGKKLSGWASATFAASGTSAYVNVPHGLAVTPDIGRVMVTLAQSSGGHQNTMAKVVSVDATNVQIEAFYTVVSAGNLRANVYCSA